MTLQNIIILALQRPLLMSRLWYKYFMWLMVNVRQRNKWRAWRSESYCWHHTQFILSLTPPSTNRYRVHTTPCPTPAWCRSQCRGHGCKQNRENLPPHRAWTPCHYHCGYVSEVLICLRLDCATQCIICPAPFKTILEPLASESLRADFLQTRPENLHFK